MNHALLLLFTAVLPLSAQTTTNNNDPVTAPQADVITATTPMRATEANEVLAASSALIEASVDLHADGRARTTHKIGDFETRIEIKGLSVREIVKAPLTEQDRKAGISRRYIAKLQCEAHRIWDAPLLTWSEWRANGYGFFPSSVIVEEINGAMKARATRIADFSPCTDVSMAAR